MAVGKNKAAESVGMAGSQIVYPYAWIIRIAYDLVEKGSVLP